MHKLSNPVPQAERNRVHSNKREDRHGWVHVADALCEGLRDCGLLDKPRSAFSGVVGDALCLQAQFARVPDLPCADLLRRRGWKFRYCVRSDLIHDADHCGHKCIEVAITNEPLKAGVALVARVAEADQRVLHLVGVGYICAGLKVLQPITFATEDYGDAVLAAIRVCGESDLNQPVDALGDIHGSLWQEAMHLRARLLCLRLFEQGLEVFPEGVTRLGGVRVCEVADRGLRAVTRFGDLRLCVAALLKFGYD